MVLYKNIKKQEQFNQPKKEFSRFVIQIRSSGNESGMSSERLSGSTREGRGKIKADSLSLALEAEAEQKAKRVKRVKSPKPSPPTKSKACKAKLIVPPPPPPPPPVPVPPPQPPVLTPVQIAKAGAKAIILAKKATAKKKKDDRLKVKLSKAKAKAAEKAAKAVVEAAFISPYLQKAADCFKSEGGRITVSRAKSEYRLNESDLSGPRYEERENPHYSSAAPMRLYDADEIAQVCKRKMITII